MKSWLLPLLSLLAPVAVAAQSPALSMGPPLTAHAVGAAPGKHVRGGSEVLVFDSYTGASTLTTTTAMPRTFIGFPFNLDGAGGSAPLLGSATAFLAYNGTSAQTYDSLRVRVQLWNGWSSAAMRVFSAAATLLEFDVPGPVTLTPDTFTPIQLTFAAPIAMTALTERGITINFQGDTGSGPADSNALTTLLRAGPPIAVGSSALADNMYGYRNVSGQTDFNFAISDARGLVGLANQGIVVQLYALDGSLIPQTITDFIATPGSPTIGDGSFTVSAVGGGSGNPVTFTIAAASATVCSASGIHGATITILATGTCTVLANQAGNATHSTAPQQSLAVTITVGNLTITPDTVTFADQTVGIRSIASTVTLANTGDGPLDVTALTAAAAPFALDGGTCSDTLPITIAAGTECTLDYTFSPTATGAADQTLTVTANAPGSGAIALSGNGVQGNLLISPTTMVFGEQPVGYATGNGVLTLVNTGTAPLDVIELTTVTAPFSRTGGDCSSTLPITIAAGASCSVSFAFTPIVVGPASQTLTVTANAPGSGTVELIGAGLQGNLTISSSTLAFGEQTVGAASDRTVTLGNTGTAGLNVTALTAAAEPFERVGGSCPIALPLLVGADTECTLVYRFTPSATGSVSQQIDIVADVPGSGAVTLEGTGVAPPDISVSIDDGRNVAGVGETLDYMIVVTNPPGLTTVDVSVLDNLPAGLANGLWDCIATGSASCASGLGATLSDTATLPPGTSVTYVYSATVQPGTEGTEIENTVSVTVSGAPDPNLANNTASDVTLIMNPVHADGFETLPEPPAP